MARSIISDLFSTSIHGLTGRPLDEGTLEPGTLVRDARIRPDGLAVRYLASTDGGTTWYLQDSSESDYRAATGYSGPLPACPGEV